MALNLATLRTKANLKQDELADRLGLSRPNISALETGRHEMQWSTFTTLAMFFAKDEEMKQIMIVMGLLTDEVEKALNITVD